MLLSPLVSSWWDSQGRSHRGKQTAWTNLMREQPVRVNAGNSTRMSYLGELRVTVIRRHYEAMMFERGGVFSTSLCLCLCGSQEETPL